MKPYGVVYLHTNKINGKVYVGKTTQPTKRRWRTVAYKSCRYFYAALLKYGFEKFDSVVLAEVPDATEMRRLEEYYMKKYDSTNPEKGYNILKMSGMKEKQSEETKAILSQQKKDMYAEMRKNGIVIVAPNKKQHVFIDNVESKHCNDCDTIKPITEFGFRKDTWDNLITFCKECNKNRMAKHRTKNPHKKLSKEELDQSYIDRSEAMNAGQKRRKELDPESMMGGKKNAKPVVAINVNTGEKLRFESASNAPGYNNSNIGTAIKRKTIYKGYFWRFDE